jgi:hypothetical protein
MGQTLAIFLVSGTNPVLTFRTVLGGKFVCYFETILRSPAKNTTYRLLLSQNREKTVNSNFHIFS